MAEKEKTEKKEVKKTTEKKENKAANALQNALNGVKSFVLFFRDAFRELENVTWLSAKQTAKFSGYVLLILVGLAVMIALLDTGFFELFKFVANA